MAARRECKKRTKSARASIPFVFVLVARWRRWQVVVGRARTLAGSLSYAARGGGQSTEGRITVEWAEFPHLSAGGRERARRRRPAVSAVHPSARAPSSLAVTARAVCLSVCPFDCPRAPVIRLWKNRLVDRPPPPFNCCHLRRSPPSRFRALPADNTTSSHRVKKRLTVATLSISIKGPTAPRVKVSTRFTRVRAKRRR